MKSPFYFELKCKIIEIFTIISWYTQLKKLENAAQEEKETELYYWAKLLAAKDWKEVDDTIKGNPYREAVKDEMYKMSQDERERYLYLREEMAYSDEISRMKTAREEGLEEGRKEERKESNYFYNV